MSRATAMLLCAAVLAAAGCTGPQYAFDVPPESDMPAERQGRAGFGAMMADKGVAPEPTPTLTVVDPRRVIYTGQMELLVADPETAVAAARHSCEEMAGYVQRVTTDTIVLRVPAERFDEIVEAIEQMGHVITRDIQAQDVTEQYVDLKIRLSNAEALLEKLKALLDRAQTVKDALAVETELARVRGQIESLKGKLNRLENRIAYATLTVHFRPFRDAPPSLRMALPFAWLKQLGLEHLLEFRG